MNKIALVLTLIFALSGISFAQSNYTESLTITTYYPAPHGVYNMMRASKMVVGSTGPVEDFADFDGALRFKPVTTPPPANTEPVGTFYFDDTNKTLQYYNGTNGWQPVGGGSGKATPFCYRVCSSYPGYAANDPQYWFCSNWATNPGICPAGYTAFSSGSSVQEVEVATHIPICAAGGGTALCNICCIPNSSVKENTVFCRRVGIGPAAGTACTVSNLNAYGPAVCPSGFMTQIYGSGIYERSSAYDYSTYACDVCCYK